MSSFIHGEVELANATGIHVKKIQAARIKHLRQGEHWDLYQQRVAYSKPGLTAVLEKIAGQNLYTFHQLAALEDRTSLIARDVPEPPLEATLQQFYPNPYRCRIRLPDGNDAPLRIKNKKNFRLGMKVPVRLNAAGGFYELTRREPRFPGRW